MASNATMASTEHTSFVSDGVVILRPTADPTPASNPQTAYLGYPNSSGAAGDATEWRNADDAEALAVFQELALRYAMEQTHSTVRAVLLRANKKCYNDVHTFLQRHMQRVPSERRDRRCAAVPRVVAFPTLRKFPAVAIVSGSDATFSDVWMTPLCQVIHRSFPLILVLHDQMDSVRRMVEWLLEQLNEYADWKKQEERWLREQVRAWKAFSEQRKSDQDPVVPSVPSSTEGPPSRLRPRPPSGRVSVDPLDVQDDSDEDYSCIDGDESTSESDDIEDDNEGGSSPNENGKKRKRRGYARVHRRPKKYIKLLVDALLQKLWERMEIIQRASDLTLIQTATLRETIQMDLRQQLKRCNGNLEQSIECYHETIEWLKSRILAYRQRRYFTTSMQAATAAFTLATVAFRVFKQFLSFLNAARPSSRADAELVTKWKRESERELAQLIDVHHLHHFDLQQYEQVAHQLEPYLLICIEQMEQFNLLVLRDFVDLWSQFAARYVGDATHSTRVGFLLGVTSTTSQTLRQLDLSIKRRLDMQFFALEDSKTRSEDILDALFVQNNFPLHLSGDALRLLDDRHLTSQSLAGFTHVLEFFALRHFQASPWSFLSRFAFDLHHQMPLFSELPKSLALRQWLVRKKFCGRSLPEVLSCFSDRCVATLLAHFGGTKPTEDRSASLDRELQRLRDLRANWIVAWKCLRLACAWLKLHDRCEGYVECLAMALDGRAAELKKLEWCVTNIQTEPFQQVKEMLEDWCVAATTSRDLRLRLELDELVCIARHVLRTHTDPVTVRMRPLFRKEVARFFLKRIIPSMKLQRGSPKTGRAVVIDWVYAVKNLSAVRTHVTMNLHEDVVDSILNLDEKVYQGSTAAGDLGLAFLHYREHATLQLSLADWFAAFADAVREEVAHDPNAVINEAELNARFVRAVATLRLWGYVKGPNIVRCAGRRHQDARVSKRIFM